ncbi:hypothetical protein COCC4DRAFT_33920 [Bipolaris maydis ATCC 48331]|uniref:Uncharacterized protein n=2 Tax=Cochliobolus heterostrophus TaxID=5016 RepID=M2TAV3_COCH5|nr:uncharacterized protein COCC4DRAFT_33920 [Bipolaris maydis ATCC 48331]EMD94695.1 hypothetical protein COCHEDRAFT_1019727 [Bipolaris maydis C5]ENI01594.1 hypothetical protein COCC4DRAFT_33920 [Bipolaris maydis ATCC 48331]
MAVRGMAVSCRLTSLVLNVDKHGLHSHLDHSQRAGLILDSQHSRRSQHTNLLSHGPIQGIHPL